MKYPQERKEAVAEVLNTDAPAQGVVVKFAAGCPDGGPSSRAISRFSASHR